MTKQNSYPLSKLEISLIHDHLAKNLPFVWFKPAFETSVKVWLQKNDGFNSYNSKSKNKGFVFAPFDKIKPTLIFPDDQCTTLSVELWKAQWSKIQSKKLSLSDQDLYENQVSRIVEAIKRGDLNKVVLSRSVVYEISTMDYFSAFSVLANSYPSVFTYALYHPQIGFWMGATPEQLVGVEGKNLDTVALAGTALWNSAGSFHWGEKEKTEQLLVVEDIREVLSPFIKNWKNSTATTVQAGLLAHLKTDINVELKEHCLNKVFSIAELLHPTAAVSGFPRSVALELLDQVEIHDREYYTGYLGPINEERSVLNLYVNLRCMKVEEGKAFLYAGGGITKDSIPFKEYEETEQKLDTLRHILFS